MQKEAREKIKILIEKYEEVKIFGKLKSYTEEDIKKGFIEPLFEILGWDMSNREEVSAEETISSERKDGLGYCLVCRRKRGDGICLPLDTIW